MGVEVRIVKSVDIGKLLGVPLRRFDQILGGALVIVALALVLDGLFALLQHLVVPRGVTAGRPPELRTRPTRRRAVVEPPTA